MEQGLKVYKSLGLSNTDANGKRVAVDDPGSTLSGQMRRAGNTVIIHSADPKPFGSLMTITTNAGLVEDTPASQTFGYDPASWGKLSTSSTICSKSIRTPTSFPPT